MTQSQKAVVRRIWDETPGLKGVVLEVSAEMAEAYTRPGQVIVLWPHDKKIYVALASSPEEAQAFEILLGASAYNKAGFQEGDEIPIAPPAGAGFPLQAAEGKDVLLFVVGSALAPMRPVIDHIRKNRSGFGRVTLYVGAHTDADFPYQKEYAGWEQDRIEIVRSTSKPWVQARFLEAPPSLDNAVAFICGMKPMMEEVRAALESKGMAKDQIASNW